MSKLSSYKWVALVMAVIMAVGFIIITRAPAEESYERLMEQERYEDLARDLNRAIAREPERYDLRMLLAEVELLLCNPMAALRQLAAAAGENITDPELEKQLADCFRKNPNDARESLDLLSQLAASEENWLWPRELAVRISVALLSEQYILETLPELLAVDDSHPLVSEAWHSMSHATVTTRWQLAQMLGSNFNDEVVSWVHSTEHLITRELRIRELYALDSSDPGAGILYGALIGGQEGQELMAQSVQRLPSQLHHIWVDLVLAKAVSAGDAAYITRWLTPEDLLNKMYQQVVDSTVAQLVLRAMALWQQEGQDLAAIPELGEFQYHMLRAAGPAGLAEALLDYIDSDDLWTLALDWLADPELSHGAAPLLDKLAGLPEWALEVERIRYMVDAVPAPKASAVFPHAKRKIQGQFDWWSVSPDANIVIYDGVTDSGDPIWWWYDINRDTHHALSFEGRMPGLAVWRGDSRYLAIQNPRIHPSSTEPDILIYDYNGKLVDFQTPQPNPGEWFSFFWQGENLVFSYGTLQGYRIQTFEPATGVLSELVEYAGRPMITATGKLVIVNDKDNIQIHNGNELKLDFGGEVRGWTAGDKELLISTASGWYIYRTTPRSLQPLETKFIFHMYTTAGNVYALAGGERVILRLDLHTYKWQPTGLHLGENDRLFDNVLATFRDGDILIYHLP